MTKYHVNVTYEIGSITHQARFPASSWNEARRIKNEQSLCRGFKHAIIVGLPTPTKKTNISHLVNREMIQSALRNLAPTC